MNEPVKAQVLVVDDDPLLLALLVETLTAIGYGVTGAPGGIDALDILQDRKFDLMVTDIKMPNLDGIQLLKKVRRHYPDMPVVFITGVATPEMISKAAPDGFLAKPFRINHIEELIERTLRAGRDRARSVGRKVLVVDQDETFRTALTEALNYSDYVPFAATTSSDAVRELESGAFDAVIADVSVPKLDGRSLPQIMQLRFPEIPVILMSSEQTTEELIESHYIRFIRKPFQAGTILELLEELSFTPQA
jgi:DNA-binding NtrC family response regulator